MKLHATHAGPGIEDDVEQQVAGLVRAERNGRAREERPYRPGVDAVRLLRRDDIRPKWNAAILLPLSLRARDAAAASNR